MYLLEVSVKRDGMPVVAAGKTISSLPEIAEELRALAAEVEGIYSTATRSERETATQKPEVR